MKTIIISRADLRREVSELLGQNSTDDADLAVMDHIASDPDRPNYGADWSAYFAALGDLWHIVEANA